MACHGQKFYWEYVVLSGWYHLPLYTQMLLFSCWKTWFDVFADGQFPMDWKNQSFGNFLSNGFSHHFQVRFTQWFDETTPLTACIPAIAMALAARWFLGVAIIFPKKVGWMDLKKVIGYGMGEMKVLQIWMVANNNPKNRICCLMAPCWPMSHTLNLCPWRAGSWISTLGRLGQVRQAINLWVSMSIYEYLKIKFMSIYESWVSMDHV